MNDLNFVLKDDIKISLSLLGKESQAYKGTVLSPKMRYDFVYHGGEKEVYFRHTQTPPTKKLADDILRVLNNKQL